MDRKNDPLCESQIQYVVSMNTFWQKMESVIAAFHRTYIWTHIYMYTHTLAHTGTHPTHALLEYWSSAWTITSYLSIFKMDYSHGLDKARARENLSNILSRESPSETYEISVLFHIKHTEYISRPNFDILVFPHPDKCIFLILWSTISSHKHSSPVCVWGGVGIYILQNTHRLPRIKK